MSQVRVRVAWQMGRIGQITTLALALAVDTSAAQFDHEYAAFAGVLRAHVHGARVDYAALKADRGPLDIVVAAFGVPAREEERNWPRAQRMAFWINAYNAFTLQAVVNHYPIQSGWFTLGPRNGIRQIDGVWSKLTWLAAGRAVTLDEIEHRILRPEFGDARIHFALNCASVSCPPLADQPYRPTMLDAQLDAAGKRYLGSAEGLRVSGETFSVSSIFKWYGEDFIAQFASLIPGTRPARERAVLGAIVTWGPAPASAAALAGRSRIRYLDYDWSLNEVPARRP